MGFNSAFKGLKYVGKTRNGYNSIRYFLLLCDTCIYKTKYTKGGGIINKTCQSITQHFIN